MSIMNAGVAVKGGKLAIKGEFTLKAQNAAQSDAVRDQLLSEVNSWWWLSVILLSVSVIGTIMSPFLIIMTMFTIPFGLLMVIWTSLQKKKIGQAYAEHIAGLV